MNKDLCNRRIKFKQQMLESKIGDFSKLNGSVGGRRRPGVAHGRKCVCLPAGAGGSPVARA